MTVPPLTFRLDKGSPLTSSEHDENLKLLRDFCDGLAKLFEVVFNPDGTLKSGSVEEASLKDRSVTQPKLDWLANFFTVASGVDNYTATISPDAGFSYGDGAADSFVCIVKFTNANTGPVTLDINSLGGINVKKINDNALVSGDIIAGSVHLLVYDGTNFQILTPLSPASASAHGLEIITTTGAGNFTVPSGVYFLDVEIVGAGGGGGGNAAAVGGGSGGYCRKKLLTTPGTLIPYTVGAKGVKSTGNNATDGGDTTFNTTIIAGGGKNGDGGVGVGGTAAGGDLNIAGAKGFVYGNGRGASDKAEGATSPLGFGSGGWRDSNGVDNNPTGYGAGGFGDSDAGGGWQSSDGTDGVIIIRW